MWESDIYPNHFFDIFILLSTEHAWTNLKQSKQKSLEYLKEKIVIKYWGLLIGISLDFSYVLIF